MESRERNSPWHRKYKEKVEQLKTQQQRYQAEGEFEKLQSCFTKKFLTGRKNSKKAEEQAGQRENSMIKEDVDEERNC
ncbi:hypothetical protein [Mycoplasma sp. ATU-Cv-508]|uniref:hypothetical protein n=1 Tax=Mycoplasma sp. ATU-Cv-508 TaxID=2048001 RepID=UPI0031F2E3D4